MRCIRPTLMAHSRATLVEANRFGAVSGAKKRKEREQLGRDFRFVWLSILVSSSGDGMFVTAFPLLAAILTRDPVLIAGITREPTAFQGDSLLLPSVAVVVLGGTSLLGGRGYPISTVVAAFFLNQLSQFALAVGVPYSAQTIIQALALGFGIGVYSIRWRVNLNRTTESKKVEEQK